MDFRQVGRAIRVNFLISLGAFILIVVIGGAAAVLPANTYKANTLLLAEPVTTGDPTGGVAAIQYFLPQLAIEVEDHSELLQVAKRVPPKYARASVAVTGVANPASGTITVNATSADPAAAAAFVNADAQLLISQTKHNPLYRIVEPSPALIPDTPSNPRKAVLFGAVAFALIAAIFAALGADAVHRRLSQGEEARAAVGLPVLAEVPRVGRRTALRPHQMFGAGSDQLLLEAFQELRSNLLLVLPADRPATIGVVSGSGGEGKSTVAAALAWALASERRTVTAIDCDLRKPTLHLLFGTALGPGVSGLRSLQLDDLVTSTRNPYLNFIPAGIPDRHPVDIVSAFVPALLHQLTDEGRHVIVDCPPLDGVAETLLVASIVDVVVLVVDARQFDPANVQQHQARLQEAGATVVGVVLNRVRIGARKRKRSYDYGVPSTALTGPIVSSSQEYLLENAIRQRTPSPSAPRDTG